MRRFGTAALLAGAVLLASAGIAQASSHGAMPSNLGFVDAVLWEFQHFGMHMSMTFQAIQVWVVSPEAGWSLLDGQALCADQGQLTGHLFDTGMHALLSFATVALLGTWIGIEVAARIMAFVAGLMRRPVPAVAQ